MATESAAHYVHSMCCHCPQLMDGGNLSDAINREDSPTVWYHTGHCIALDVARALSFLHSHNVLHGVAPHRARPATPPPPQLHACSHHSMLPATRAAQQSCAEHTSASDCGRAICACLLYRGPQELHCLRRCDLLERHYDPWKGVTCAANIA